MDRISLIAEELPRQIFQSVVLELNLVYSENRGVNFGLFGAGDANQLIFAGVAGLVCAFFGVLLLFKCRGAHAVAGGLIVGGGLSNIYERLAQGFVFDYINTPFLGIPNPYSYNIADIFIVLPLLWWVLLAD